MAQGIDFPRTLTVWTAWTAFCPHCLHWTVEREERDRSAGRLGRLEIEPSNLQRIDLKGVLTAWTAGRLFPSTICALRQWHVAARHRRSRSQAQSHMNPWNLFYFRTLPHVSSSHRSSLLLLSLSLFLSYKRIRAVQAVQPSNCFSCQRHLADGLIFIAVQAVRVRGTRSMLRFATRERGITWRRRREPEKRFRVGTVFGNCPERGDRSIAAADSCETASIEAVGRLRRMWRHETIPTRKGFSPATESAILARGRRWPNNCSDPEQLRRATLAEAGVDQND